MSFWERIVALFTGQSQPRQPRTHRNVAHLLKQLREGEVRRLPDADLVSLIEELEEDPALTPALRGNTRFLGSVKTRFYRRGSLTLKQRYAVYNILERAFPHNLPGVTRPGRRKP